MLKAPLMVSMEVAGELYYAQPDIMTHVRHEMSCQISDKITETLEIKTYTHPITQDLLIQSVPLYIYIYIY